MSNSEAIAVDLGEHRRRFQERIESGECSSVSEVSRAGLKALEREEAAWNGIMREKIQESLDDPRPDIPIAEVFESLLRDRATPSKASP